jgi:hypothetical protein
MRALLLTLAVVIGCTRSTETDDAPATEDTDSSDLTCGEAPFGAASEDADFFVQQDTPEGGDGSEGAPFQTLKEAIEATTGAPASIAIAAGTYDEMLSLDTSHAGLTLHGRCAELVTLDGGNEGFDSYTIDIGGEAEDVFVLRGLTITGGESGGLRVHGGDVTVEDASVIEANEAGVWASWDETHVVLRRVLVAETLADSWGEYGFGVSAQLGADLVMEECVVRDNHNYGVLAADTGTVVSLSNVTISGTVPDPDFEGVSGYALAAAAGAAFSASNVTLSENNGGIIAVNTGTTVTVQDSLIQDNTTMGIIVDHATGTAERISVTGGMGGIAGSGAALLTLTDVEVLEASVSGLEIEGGALVDATGLIIADAGEIGIALQGAGSVLHIDETTIGPVGGRGVQVLEGAVLDATDLTIVDVVDFGLLMGDEGTTAALTGGTIGPVASAADGETGYGIVVQGLATVSLTGTTVVEATRVGVLATSEATATLVDVEIADIRRSTAELLALGLMSQYSAHLAVNGGEVHGVHGPGVLASAGGSIALSGTSVHDNAFAGLVATFGGALEANDVSVSEISADSSMGGGVGVYSDGKGEGAPVTLTGCDISGVALDAVWTRDAGNLVITDSVLVGGEGVVSSTPNGDTQIHGEALFAAGDTVLAASGGTWTSEVAAAALLHDVSSASWDGVALDGIPDIVVQHCEDAIPEVPAEAEASVCETTELPWLEDLELLIELVETPGSE